MNLNDKKELNVLKIYGFLMLVLGILDIVAIAADLLLSDVSFAGIGAGGIVFIVIIYLIGICIVLAKIWLGVKGIQYGNGNGKGTSHIKIAKIGIVLCGLAAALTAVEVIGGAADIGGLISDAASLFVIVMYYQAAKKCL